MKLRITRAALILFGLATATAAECRTKSEPVPIAETELQCQTRQEEEMKLSIVLNLFDGNEDKDENITNTIVRETAEELEQTNEKKLTVTYASTEPSKKRRATKEKNESVWLVHQLKTYGLEADLTIVNSEDDKNTPNEREETWRKWMQHGIEITAE